MNIKSGTSGAALFGTLSPKEDALLLSSFHVLEHKHWMPEGQPKQEMVEEGQHPAYLTGDNKELSYKFSLTGQTELSF